MGRGLVPGSGGVGWCYVCEFGVWILCLDGRPRCLADNCASEVHPVFNPDAPYGYLLPNMHLFIADITNPDSFV